MTYDITTALGEVIILCSIASGLLLWMAIIEYDRNRRD